MLKKVALITIFMSGGLLYAANKTPETHNVEDVDSSLQHIYNEFSSGIESPAPVAAEKPVVVAEQSAAPAVAPAPVPAPTPAPAPVPAPVVAKPAPAPVVVEAPKQVPALKTKEKIDGPIYHYSYVPEEAEDDPARYEEGTMAGHRGSFVLTFMGEGVVYSGYNAGKPGFNAEIGWQINMFKYLSLLPSIDFGIRKGNTSKNLVPVGAKLALRFRVLPWLFPYAEGGFECIKVSSGGWEPISKVFGGGLAIRIGYADMKAEYNLYKLVGITRTMLILGFDYIKTPHNSEDVPNATIFKGGLSFEF